MQDAIEEYSVTRKIVWPTAVWSGFVLNKSRKGAARPPDGLAAFLAFVTVASKVLESSNR